MRQPRREHRAAAAVTADLLRRPTVSAKVAVVDKVRVVEELTCDQTVATTGLLRRPDASFRAMSDDSARHQVNHAQAGRGHQARENFERTSPVTPAVRQINRTVEFFDLVTACHSFVAAAGRASRSPPAGPAVVRERAVVHQNIAEVQATLDWIENAVDTGKVDMDDELARLLRGHWPCPGLAAPGRRRPAARGHPRRDEDRPPRPDASTSPRTRAADPPNRSGRVSRDQVTSHGDPLRRDVRGSAVARRRLA
ncbi:DUF6192 family protein [Streptomyces tritici]|uniref:DUF6192 family protein n=1 Tax=Streptomyces tritici TaxID=2054410 RepID=UPI003AF01A71